MTRRLPTKKILVATIGVGAVSYVFACGGSTSSSTGTGKDGGGGVVDSSTDQIVSSGNLMAPQPDSSSADVGSIDVVESEVISTGGNLMPPTDAGHGGGD